MTKRKWAWTATIAAAIIAVAGACWSVFGVHEISMSQADIQTKIDEKMPASQKGVTISNAKIDLSATTKFNTEYRMNTATRGTLRYDHSRGAFYFVPEELKVSDIQANGASVAEKVGGFIDKWVDSKKIQDNKAELAAKAEDIAQGLVQKTAASVLERVPVYKLKDDFKGYVVRAVLSDVEVKDGHVIAHLSLWQLTKTVLVFAFAFVVAIGFMVALIANPEWGIPLLLIGSIGDLS
jgi:hypothetical protein